MSTKGNLLVSTKTNTTARKTVVIVGCMIYFILGIIVFSLTPSGETFGYVLGGLCIGYAIFYLLLGLSNLKSYCEVYENAVVGTTTMGLTTPVQNFEIRYDEIMNVTESGKSIQIYTQYTTYKTIALANATAAVSEIRARMKGHNA